jgi:hypothetical protein
MSYSKSLLSVIEATGRSAFVGTLRNGKVYVANVQYTVGWCCLPIGSLSIFGPFVYYAVVDSSVAFYTQRGSFKMQTHFERTSKTSADFEAFLAVCKKYEIG